MKLQFLFGGAFLLCAAFAVNAQETFYSQDFEAGHEAIYAEGWKVIGFTGSTENNGVYGSSPSIVNAGFNGSTIGGATFTIVGQIPTHIQDADSATQSPEFSLPEDVQELTFRAGSVNISGNANSHYSVYAVTAQDLEGIETDEELKELLDAAEPLDAATIGGQSAIVTTGISSLAGQSVTFFFRLHETTGNNLLLFDDITITSGTMGTETPENNLFSVYPNPVRDMLNISAPQHSPVTTLRVYTVSGQLVTYKRFATAVESYNLDMSSLAAGMYIVKMTSELGTEVKRVVKG